jgi:acyl-CoA-binding protein
LQDSESLLDQEKMSDLKDRFSYKAFNELMDKSQKQEER